MEIIFECVEFACIFPHSSPFVRLHSVRCEGAITHALMSNSISFEPCNYKKGSNLQFFNQSSYEKYIPRKFSTIKIAANT